IGRSKPRPEITAIEASWAPPAGSNRRWFIFPAGRGGIECCARSTDVADGGPGRRPHFALQDRYVAHTLIGLLDHSLGRSSISSVLDAETVVRSRPLAWAPALGHRFSRLSKGIVLLLVCLWLADRGMSLLIEHSSLKDKLTARLEAAFGRRVQVGKYRVTVWTGPTLEAQSVTVGEDPRFGREYFLRADSVSVRPRWQSLLRGRFELGALSLSRPSLTIVRGSRGDWNLTEWLPKPSPSPIKNGAFGGSRPASSALRFRRIEVDNG